jgi:hypothetical protein
MSDSHCPELEQTHKAQAPRGFLRLASPGSDWTESNRKLYRRVMILSANT